MSTLAHCHKLAEAVADGLDSLDSLNTMRVAMGVEPIRTMTDVVLLVEPDDRGTDYYTLPSIREHMTDEHADPASLALPIGEQEALILADALADFVTYTPDEDADYAYILDHAACREDDRQTRAETRRCQAILRACAPRA